MQGDYLLASLRRLAHPAIIDIRGKGLLVGVEIDPAFAGARGSAMRWSTKAC